MRLQSKNQRTGDTVSIFFQASCESWSDDGAEAGAAPLVTYSRLITRDGLSWVWTTCERPKRKAPQKVDLHMEMKITRQSAPSRMLTMLSAPVALCDLSC